MISWRTGGVESAAPLTDTLSSVGVSITRRHDAGDSLVAILATAMLVLAWAGQWIAMAAHSRTIALAALALYAAGFVVLAALRPSLALIALVVAVPLVTIEIGFGDVEKTVSGDKIAVAVVAAMWVIRRGHVAAAALLKTSAVRWWLVFLALISVSAIAQGLSKAEAWNVTATVIYALVFMLALDVFLHDPGVRDSVLLAAGVTAGVVAGIGLIERLLWSIFLSPIPLYFKDGTQPPMYSIGSTIGHTNFLAGYLALVLGPLLVLAWRGSSGRRKLLLTSSALVTIALVVARSIGALVGVAAGAFIVVVIGSTRTQSRRVRIGLVAAVVVAIALASGIAADKLGVSTNPIGVRVATLRIGMAAIAEHPWLGSGANGYVRESPRLEAKLFGSDLGRWHPVGQSLSAHSSYLNVAVERGVPALIGFLAVLGAVFVAAVRAGTARATPERDALLVIGLLAGLVAFAVQATTENLFNYSKVATIFWIMAAAVVSFVPRGSPRTVS